ncbi:unnamed protein product [Rhizophagus irregularis]|uniref:Uncharacterized protein n=1 Tax=Rhizophagus irregularis TaxID=588596 RepID=A0A2N1NM02_9GLOM|nr:hypothetical protein RhiirC2_774210 [Rhizophagus irregularis]CAB4375080.1 unnamed protein product [Rhizophagus irregularis]CAB5305196.1 unnamed protein product [Rhizophagus irregularis]
MNQNHNFSHNLQLADLQAGGQDNLNPFYNFDSLNMNAFNTSQNHFHDNINNTNGYYPNVNLSDTTFQPQLNRSNIFIFEIPGFEIVIRPKVNQFMNLNNLNNLNMPSMNSYSSVAANQNYVDGNSASGSYVNNMNTMNMQNIYNNNNNQSFITNNSQYQFQQQNSLGYNNHQG